MYSQCSVSMDWLFFHIFFIVFVHVCVCRYVTGNGDSLQEARLGGIFFGFIVLWVELMLKLMVVDQSDPAFWIPRAI